MSQEHEQTLCGLCEGLDPAECPQCDGDPMGYWYRPGCQCGRCCKTRLEIQALLLFSVR
jgi:hypothetical protein